MTVFILGNLLSLFLGNFKINYFYLFIGIYEREGIIKFVNKLTNSIEKKC